ncbi:MAG: T9SS type A sorting domain-containing protein [Ignavibacteria bacterium]
MAVSFNNTFSGDPNETTYGNVTWNYYSVCSASKRGAGSIQTEDWEKDFAYEEFSALNNNYQAILTEVNKAILEKNFNKENYVEDFETIIKGCKTFILSNSASDFAPTAIKLAADSYKQNRDFEGMKTFLDEIITNNDLQNLHGTAELYSADYYTSQQNYYQALETLDNIILSYGEEDSKTFNENLVCESLISKGYIHEFSLNNPDDAIEDYSKVLSNYPENIFAKYAKIQLKNLGIESEETPGSENLSNESSELSIENYPNPFNPATIISYTLPEEGRVSIKIYDILGREVETIVNEIRTAGTHSVEFNASHLPSGVYLYRIETSRGMLTKKMLLLK